MDRISVRIIFEADVDYNGKTVKYTDAIYIPISEYSSMNQQEIESRKQARIQNYMDWLKTPQTGETPTSLPFPSIRVKEYAFANKLAMQNEIEIIESRKTELSASIQAIDEII